MTATPWKDYEPDEGTVTFKPQETSAVIRVKIVKKPPEEVRDEVFGIVLKSITPEGAKLSKKSMQIVNIITDQEKKKKEDMYL